jgi:hypothetical protein
VAAITDQTVAASSTSRRRAATRERCTPGRIEVTLRNGGVVTAEEGIAPATLARIVAALDALSSASSAMSSFGVEFTLPKSAMAKICYRNNY